MLYVNRVCGCRVRTCYSSTCVSEVIVPCADLVLTCWLRVRGSAARRSAQALLLRSCRARARVCGLVVAVPALGRAPTATCSHVPRQLSLGFVFHTVQPTVAQGLHALPEPTMPAATAHRVALRPPSTIPGFSAPWGCVEHLLPEATGFRPLGLALWLEEHILPRFLRRRLGGGALERTPRICTGPPGTHGRPRGTPAAAPLPCGLWRHRRQA